MNARTGRTVTARGLALLVAVALLAAAIGSCCITANAAGLARSEHFSVYTAKWKGWEPDNKLAEAIVKRAELYRSQIAADWFSTEPPPVRTTIYIEFGADEKAFHLGKGNGPIHANAIFIGTAKPDSSFAHVLKHEICHAVCASFYPHPNRVPKELEEQIALTYNTPTKAAQRRILKAKLRAWEATAREPEPAAERSVLVEDNQ